jgi:hypothetical protein
MSVFDHRCGPGCLVCQTAIDRQEFGDERSWGDEGGQEQYERNLDRMGEF